MKNNQQNNKCISDGKTYTSIPPQNKCKNCGKYWIIGDGIPDCGADSGCRYGEQEPIGTDCQCDLGSEKHYHPDCEYLSEQKGEECKHDIESNCCPAYCKKCGINIDINTPSTPSIGDIDSEKEKLVFWNKLSIVEKADLDFFISALLSSQKNKIEGEILTKAKVILDEEQKFFGTDKHGLSFEQLKEILKSND